MNKWKFILEKKTGLYRKKVLMDLTGKNKLMFLDHKAHKISKFIFLANKPLFSNIYIYTYLVLGARTNYGATVYVIL